MSPRIADDRIRLELIEAAARILAQEGPDALTTRRVAAEVGTSTMALYTHFDGMDDLRRAVRLAWFERLSEHLSQVSRTTDPVADLGALGWAYFFNAVENEHLYRITVVDPLPDPQVATMGLAAFRVLVDAVKRCTDEGRLHPGDALARAMQIWMAGNGVLVACLAGFITVDAAIDHFYEMAGSLLATFGDDADAAPASLARGRRRMARRQRTTARGSVAG